MISPDNLKLLEELGKTQFGVALREFLTEKLGEISNVKNSKTVEDLLGNQKAISIIEDLFAFMREKKTPTKKKHEYE